MACDVTPANPPKYVARANSRAGMRDKSIGLASLLGRCPRSFAALPWAALPTGIRVHIRLPHLRTLGAHTSWFNQLLIGSIGKDTPNAYGMHWVIFAHYRARPVNLGNIAFVV